MDENLIEKYKQELMRMYRSAPGAGQSFAVQQASAVIPEPNEKEMPAPDPIGFIGQKGEQRGVYDAGETPVPYDSNDLNGKLIAIVTAVSGIYPIPEATVTVFTGPYENMNRINSSVTDESGRIQAFELPAPPRNLSMQSETTERPYTLYNLLVEAKDYVPNIHMNIPVFRGVTSLQKSNLLPLSAIGEAKGPIIYDESAGFEL